MRVDESLGDLLAVEAARQGSGGGVHHVVGDAGDLAEDGAEAEAGEDVHVVTLVGVVGGGDVSDLGLEGREGGSGSEERGAVGPGDGLLEGAFGLGERVGEREEDGAATGAGGVNGGLEGAHDGLGEDAVGGGEADEGGGLDVFDDLFEGLELVAGVVVA
ncbi:hypothetical protein V492_03381, partial [Pseudogymnoascus sp. VKM F-4246]